MAELSELELPRLLASWCDVLCSGTGAAAGTPEMVALLSDCVVSESSVIGRMFLELGNPLPVASGPNT